MSRWSARGQVEPLAAFVAMASVCLGLSLYAGVVADALPGRDSPDTEAALDAVHDRLAPNGVASPEGFSAAVRPPDGLQLNATLTTTAERWTSGPTPPATATSASRRLSVRLAPARVRPATLRVTVW